MKKLSQYVLDVIFYAKCLCFIKYDLIDLNKFFLHYFIVKKHKTTRFVEVALIGGLGGSLVYDIKDIMKGFLAKFFSFIFKIY